MREYRFPTFEDGVNNVGREDQIPSTSLREARNVDLLVSGQTAKLRRRKGRERVVAGVGCHSGVAGSDFVLSVDSGTLKLWRDLTQAPEEVATGVGEVGYAEFSGGVIWSDGVQSGIVLHGGATKPFGLPAPNGAPNVGASPNGGLYAGEYLVAVTFTRDGVESGASDVVSAAVAEGEGIQLSSIPQPADADAINIYATQANGETLYFRASIPVGTSAYVLGALDAKRAAQTLSMDMLPMSQRLAMYNAHLFSLVGDTLYFSRPFNYQLHHTTEDYVLLGSEGNLLLAGDDGVFVGTEDGVYFFGGEEPQRFTQSWVSAAAIPDAGLSLDGGFVAGKLQGRTVAVWWTVDGVMMLGLPGGAVEPVRDVEFRATTAERGVVAATTREGTKQLVTVLRNPGARSPMAFSDSVTIEVHKHGVQ